MSNYPNRKVNGGMIKEIPDTVKVAYYSTVYTDGTKTLKSGRVVQNRKELETRTLTPEHKEIHAKHADARTLAHEAGNGFLAFCFDVELDAITKA